MHINIILKPKYSAIPQSRYDNLVNTAWSLVQLFVDIYKVHIQEQNNDRSIKVMETGYYILNS
jgi:hypothetical protein